MGQTKWGVQVQYEGNGHRSSATLKGLNAPTESEAERVLYEQCRFMKYTNIVITNKWSYIE